MDFDQIPRRPVFFFFKYIYIYIYFFFLSSSDRFITQATIFSIFSIIFRATEPTIGVLQDPQPLSLIRVEVLDVYSF